MNPNTNHTPIVQLYGIEKKFDSFTALHSLDLEIYRGEFLTFLGPSGCGKTTLLRLISGLEEPTTGTISLEGKEMTHTPAHQRDVNQVFQSYALFPHLNIEQNILFGLKMKKIPRDEQEKRLQEVLQLVQLKGMEKRMPHQLSGGQRQRVAMARALVCQPKVLLLDEPLSALDAQLRHQMQIELKRIQLQLGITFVFVTHDQEEALVLSDRIMVMSKGRVEQIGSPTEIYQNPQTPFVASFIGSTNIFHVLELKKNENSINVRISSQQWLQFDLPASLKESKELQLFIRPEKIQSSRSSVNSLEGKVTQTLFKGDLNDILVKDRDENEWRIRLSANTPSPQIGDAYSFSIPSSAGLLL